MTTLDHLSDFRLLISEEIDLEMEDYETAKQYSNLQENEAEKWQVYLKMLGLCSLEHWLMDNCTSSAHFNRELDTVDTYPYLNYRGFRFCLIVQEDFLENAIYVPFDLLQDPKYTAHFYIFLEILEEEAIAILKGFIRYDQLSQLELVKVSEDQFLFPLRYLNFETNHLITACQFLTPDIILLPQTSQNESQISFQKTISELIQLSQGVLSNGWNYLENLLIPQPQLVFRSGDAKMTENQSKTLYKLIPLGENLTVVLLMEIDLKPDGKLGVKISLRSRQKEDILPETISLILKTGKGNIKERIQGSGQDNLISLQKIKLKPQQQFQVEIIHQKESYHEVFIF